MAGRALALQLRAIRFWDRLRLRWLCSRHPGLEIHPDASTNLASARYSLAPGARLRIGAGVATERLPGALHFDLRARARVEIGERAWLRTDVGAVHVVAFDGARIEIGPDALLNGCHLSAKSRLELGRRVFVGVGSRVFDGDQHDFDADHSEQVEPVRIGDHTWIAADVTVLRGVEIGEHSVVGARSLVTSDIPDHTLAYGIPAKPHGKVGDRSRAR